MMPKFPIFFSAMPLEIVSKDILTFFEKNERSKNDETNRKRENILSIISNPPAEFINDVEYGNYWTHLMNEFNNVIDAVGKRYICKPFDNYTIEMKGGVSNHIDFIVSYNNGAELVRRVKLEFKNGGKNICQLPQFLSLPTHKNLLDCIDYAEYYYNYLDMYIATDSGITIEKPPLHIYLKSIRHYNSDQNEFIKQIDERKHINKEEKNKIGVASIRDYLIQYSNKLNLDLVTETIRETQKDKIFILWEGGKFNIDTIDEEYMDITGIKEVTNNTIVLAGNGVTFNLYLRWRNGNGILNPTWQISMRKLIDYSSEET